MHIDLQRFEVLHPAAVHIALDELREGRRLTGWTTALLPRLGDDEFGLRSIAEAEAYLLEGMLFRDYGRLIEVVRDHVVVAQRSLGDLFGTPDDLEVIASVTLTRGVCARLTGSSFTQLQHTCDEVLRASRPHGYDPCLVTLALLATP